MRFDADQPGRLALRCRSEAVTDTDTGTDTGIATGTVAEYVYDSDAERPESPRPYLRLRALSGVEVTGHRPPDHVWHTGLSLALPVVGPHNFWGGPTYVHGEGYLPLANNGTQRHRSFAPVDTPARLVELLDWRSEHDAPVLAERRTLTARVIDEQTWALTWRSELRNVSGADLVLGSPATNGREGAGYGGIFWRGPTSFTGGAIVRPDGPAGDAACGEPAPWLAFVAPDRSAGVLMLDVGEERDPWFARTAEYAGLGPAPFFAAERTLAADGTLVLSAAVAVGAADVAALAPTVGAALVAELRSHVDTPEDAA